jgi:probable F420-dependent oxidoreductase
MKIEAALLTGNLSDIPKQAQLLEELGFDGVFTFDGPLEPFLPLLLAAEHTSKVTLTTGVAIALARTPMIVAQLAHELHQFSKGRMVLGLGSQIRAHIERRFGAVWSKPNARMREFVLALRAIFASFNHGERLKFEGEFYQHTLLPPLLNPGASGYGSPPIILAGVGPSMTEIAGEVADGLLVHPFHSRAYLESCTLPAIAKGKARSTVVRKEFRIICQALVVTAEDEDEYRNVFEMTRNQIAFYASTPAYKGVLEVHGWDALHHELHVLSKQGKWGEMAGLISDSMVETLAICGKPEAVAKQLRERYATISEHIAIATPFPLNHNALRNLVEHLHSAE